MKEEIEELGALLEQSDHNLTAIDRARLQELISKYENTLHIDNEKNR